MYVEEYLLIIFFLLHNFCDLNSYRLYIGWTTMIMPLLTLLLVAAIHHKEGILILDFLTSVCVLF